MKTYKQFNEGLKDYSNQGKNVRVPGEDTASFGKLFKDDLKQMGKNARKLIEEKYDNNHCSSRLKKVYLDLYRSYESQ